MRALLLPCCLIWPVGPWKWASAEESSTQDLDIAATVTHQTLKAREQVGSGTTHCNSRCRYISRYIAVALQSHCGHIAVTLRLQVERYDPLAGPQCNRNATAKQADRPSLAHQRSVTATHSLRPFTWTNPAALPESVRDPNSGEDAAVPSTATHHTHTSEWGE